MCQISRVKEWIIWKKEKSQLGFFTFGCSVCIIPEISRYIYIYIFFFFLKLLPKILRHFLFAIFWSLFLRHGDYKMFDLWDQKAHRRN